MYEASFGLKRRPFAATPDATCFLSSGPIQAALDELVVCVEQGQGIGILTASAGTGKTLLCERLRFELGDRFETVFLRHASFLTRRALLQTILCELNLSYNHPSEQELRLELFPAIRALRSQREALVLICDEAHQLTDSLLEELRILADFAESGHPLVRLVLVGQLSLEEKLTQPAFAAFNQRIRAQINLSTFDHAGSLDYLDYRLTWAGGRTNEIFKPAALDLIVRASDGVPRCINQLADHTLLLAFVAEQKPAGEELVREALNDLRQLPLHWNEPLSSRSFSDHSETIFDTIELNPMESHDVPPLLDHDLSGYLKHSTATAAMCSYEPIAPSENESHDWNSTEFDVPIARPVTQMPAAFKATEMTSINRIEVGSDDWRQTVELFSPRSVEGILASGGSSLQQESTIVTTDVGMTATMTRRNQFHELLQDAYIAAGELANPLMESETLAVGETIETTNSVETPFHSTIEEPRADERQSIEPSTDSIVPVNASLMTTRYDEEVIVDRYASIDAGFAPPLVSLSDTIDTDKVRVVQDDFEFPQSETNRLLDERASESGTNMICEENEGVARVADEVISLAQSLHPAGELSVNSESILTALRREIVDLSMITASDRVDQNSLPARAEAWQSIETTAVEPAVETRPFRYLFSALRRKQRGLA